MYKFILKLKRNILTIIICLFLFIIFVFSEKSIIATKNAIFLWSTCIVPSLFPFFLATELLNKTKVPELIGKHFNKFIQPLFYLPGEAFYAFFIGILCGYPTGTKIVSDFYNTGICTKHEAERMLAFTNNSSPLFIIGTVGISFFSNSRIGILLLITHLLSSISIGILFGYFCRLFFNSEKRSVKTSINSSKKICINNFGDSLTSGIISSVNTLFTICGFIIIFSIIISVLNSIDFFDIFKFTGIPVTQSKAFFSGIIELTTGVNLASNILNNNLSTNVIICSFLLGFGGLSVLLQVFSISSKYGLSIKLYFFGKVLQGILSATYTFILLNYFSL